MALPGLARSALGAEHEVVLALEPGYGLLAGDGAENGIGGSASAWVGISEMFWISATGGEVTFFPKAGGTRFVYEVGGGLVAAFDVLRTIPFAEAQIVAVASRGALVPTFRAGIGADYLLNKAISVGGVIRYRPLTSEIAADGILSVFFRLGLRLEL
jgi:hypothetical protein